MMKAACAKIADEAPGLTVERFLEVSLEDLEIEFSSKRRSVGVGQHFRYPFCLVMS